MIRTFLLLALFAFALNSNAQSVSFSQYNAALGSINPAYIAQIDRNQASVISRWQWPGHANAAWMHETSFNKFFPKINSSFGISANQLEYTNRYYKNQNAAFQYAYRVMFLERFYISAGVSVNYHRNSIDLYNFEYHFSPKTVYTEKYHTISSQQYISSSFGIIFQEAYSKFYFGACYNHGEIYPVSASGPGYFGRRPSFSFQAMKSIPVTRASTAFLFMNIERVGRNTYLTDIDFERQNAYTQILVQGNIAAKKFIAGAGYKIFTGNYGSPVFRMGWMPSGKVKNKYEGGQIRGLTIGYACDLNPYIQYDKIKSYYSHEVYIKKKFNY